MNYRNVLTFVTFVTFVGKAKRLRSVYVFIVDCLRFDTIGKVTHEGSLTPHIDEFAHDAVTFLNAVAQSTWSRNAGAAIMTGLYPAATGLVPTLLAKTAKENKSYKSAAITPQVQQTLATLFQKNGFQTFGYSANPFFSKRFNMSRGFNTFPSMFSDPILSRRAEAGNDLADRLERKALPIITTRDLLDAMHRDKSEKDHLTVIWTMDTHPPLYDRYRADQVNQIPDTEIVSTIISAKHDISRAETIYQSCVRYFDHQFGEFIENLKQRGKYENSTIVLTADHGESFGEHGLYGHSGFPYEEQIHIPLLIKFPDNVYAAHQTDHLVGAIDILPTLADVYGLQMDGPVHGKSILSILKGEEPNHDYLVVHDQTHDDHWEYYCIRFPTQKYIARHLLRIMNPKVSLRKLLERLLKRKAFDKRQRIISNMLAPLRNLMSFESNIEIFDLSSDQAESNNLAVLEGNTAITSSAENALEEYLSKVKTFIEQNEIEYVEADVDEKLLLRLQKLGYIE